MLLQLYSWVIFLLEFCFLIVRCAILWAKVFYKTLYPDEFEPLDGKVVLVSVLLYFLFVCSDKFIFPFRLQEQAMASVERWHCSSAVWDAF